MSRARKPGDPVRNIPSGAHLFDGKMCCNQCPHREPATVAGAASMRAHIRQHPAGRKE